ncbi:MAG: gamma-glutamyl-gamma-aminobutyrate hydrolase family protein [Desulfobacterales bacterium]|nr:gamma-glutamyl-gamma-aminobutyrate hydrolase family protein [Desulfobacterales bacterium]
MLKLGNKKDYKTKKGCLNIVKEPTIPDHSGPVIGVPGYWHESDAILGHHATAVPDSYIRALSKMNAVPLIIPVIQSRKILKQLFQMIDGLLLIGGPDLDPVHYHQSKHPGLRTVTLARDNMEMQVSLWALEADLPIMAICRGIQVLNVAAGGTLWQDIASQLPSASKHDYHPDYPKDFLAHTVKPVPDSRLAEIIGEDDVSVNSLHHQAIDKLGQNLRTVAHSPDGIIEAVEGINASWIVGVQWHPEWLIESDQRMMNLFKTFGDACSRYGDA